MHPPVVEFRGISKTFRPTWAVGEKYALSNVTLSIPPGSVLGLVGANGSGKSTLIKCALGLLRPTRGTSHLFGEDSWDLSAAAKARIGYVPQEMTSYPWMRVRQVIAYTAAFYSNWNPSFVDELCRRWHVPLEDRIGELSPGQLQSVGIVLALGHEPDLLMLDEPVASLDPAARRQFLRTILELLDGHKRTVVFSSHITSDLERIANRVAILSHGCLRFHGEIDELKDHVKRLRISSRHDLPEDFKVPGTLRCEVTGSNATVSVTNFDEHLVDDMRREWDADVSVHDLNLEEIFVELHDAAVC